MWIIQSANIREDGVRQLAEALNEYGIPFEDVAPIPFSNEFVTEPKYEGMDIIPYGSTSLMRIAQRRGWTGLFFDPEMFTVEMWNKQRKDMLNQDAEIMTVEEAMVEMKNEFPTVPYFIRPNCDLKAFNGTVTNAEEIGRWLESVDSGSFQIPEKTLVAISKPQNLYAEYRFFIVGGKVISGSSYRLEGLRLVQRVTDEFILKDAQKLANDWLPHETCVMDMTYLYGDKRPRVIEFNCFNASGFYYHDVRAVGHAVTQYFNTIKLK